MTIDAALEDARRIVGEAMAPTPQIAWPLLSRRLGVETWMKHDNHTPIGAFKLRGGIVHVTRLLRARPEVRHLIAATRGNHGQAVAFGANPFQECNIPALPAGARYVACAAGAGHSVLVRATS